MDSLLILLPEAQETQLMPSCTTYRTQTNSASGSVWESHCHRIGSGNDRAAFHSAHMFDLRSKQTKASLAATH